MQKIAIIGAGAFGFALAKIIGDKHSDKDVWIYDIQEEYIRSIVDTKEHPLFKTLARLSPHIRATTNLEETMSDAKLIILSVPSVYMRNALKSMKPYLQNNTILLNVAKGLEINTNMIMSEVIADELTNTGKKIKICSLSGGMIAKEVVLKNPLCAEVACVEFKVAQKVVKLLENEYFRLEATTDLLGIELAGAFKNVIAIGAGLFDGLGYSASSKSAFVSYAAKEVSKLAFALGAKKETFDIGSQAWFGDLMTTCFGNSRNREFGEFIGRTSKVEETLAKLRKEGKTVEGYITAKVVYDLMLKNKIKAPLVGMIYKILYKKMSPERFIRSFIMDW